MNYELHLLRLIKLRNKVTIQFYLCALFLCTINLCCKGQTIKADTPSFTLMKSYTSGKIEYQFPDKVKAILDSFLQSNSFKCGFINLDGHFKHDTALLVVLSMSCRAEQQNDPISEVLKVTNRYYSFGKNQIPILVEDDWAFGYLGFGISDGDLEIEFTNYRSLGGGTIVNAYSGITRIR